jgi:kumamolisin
MLQTRSRLLALAGATTLSLCLAGGLALGSSGSAPSHPSSVAGDPLSSQPQVLGQGDRSAVIEIGLGLRSRDPEGEQAFLEDLYDPSSPDYRQFLTPEQIGQRFGISDADLDWLTAELEAAGLSVVGTYPQRTSIRVQGSVAALEAFVGTPIEQLRDGRNGAVYYAASGTPSVPAGLGHLLTGVTGLDRHLPVGAIDPSAAPPPPDRGLKPTDLARAYGFESMWQSGITGDGTAVAILQFGVDTDQDLAVFDAAFGISGPVPERIPVGEGLVNAPADFATEAVLDTQVVRAVAPDAQILVFGADVTAGFAAIVDAIVADGRAKVASLSYGQCFAPGYVSQGSLDSGARSFAAAAQAGVSIFAASGDWGAFSCHAFVESDHQVSTFWPSCADNIVSVGGTFLKVRDDGSYREEIGWQDYLVTGGTGGGVNPLEARPAYQTGVPGIDNDRSNGNRQCPDVAASADPDTGYLVFETDPDAGPVWKMIGGTSAAAPMWAGSMALVEQYAAGQGIDQLGFLNPMFYRIAGTTPGAFHDVIRGGNLLDVSGPGWDYATGLGSPNLQVLADAIVQELQGG